MPNFDAEHLWHPYAKTPPEFPPYLVRAAQGARLILDDGRVLIDGMSSWWCVIHGYRHPELDAALQAQLQDFAHVMFGGLTHRPALALGEALLALLPAPLSRIFYCDSGSVAVEVAMKMALQYQQARGEARVQFATILGGYHGDTWHPMSVCDPMTGMHQRYHGRLMPQHFLPRPVSRFEGPFLDADRQALETFFAAHGHSTAAFILEPIAQGAGGMWFYHPDYLRHLRRLCDHYGVLLIADEIATGFGRTGRMFALEHAQIVPDILCLGKALTGGYLSFAATIARETIAATIARTGVLMHGPTFMGNALACAVARASLGILARGTWQAQVDQLAATFRAQLAPLANRDYVAELRVLGGIGVVELKEPVDLARITPLFVARGVWVRPFGKLAYLMPPYTITKEELEALCSGFVQALEDYHG